MTVIKAITVKEIACSVCGIVNPCVVVETSTTTFACCEACELVAATAARWRRIVRTMIGVVDDPQKL